MGAAVAVALLALTLLIGRWWVRRRLPPLAKVRPRRWEGGPVPCFPLWPVVL